MNLLNLFSNELELSECEPGETVFEEGEPGERLYVVLEGEVSLSVRGTRVDTMRPGDMFGEMALIDTKPRSATATAVSACKLAPIDERRFLFLVQQTPFFALHVMRVMASRLRAMDDTLS